MTIIPNPPTLGDSFTNDSTGVSYSYDGEKWVITSTPGSEQSDQLSEDLTSLTTRVSTGENIQDEILQRVSSGEVTQGEISNRVGDIEQVIEQLQTTRDSGRWTFRASGSTNNPVNGEFTFRRADGTSQVRLWEDCQFATLSYIDSGGITHDFSSWQAGDRVEFYSIYDSGHAIFELGNWTGSQNQFIFNNLLEFYGVPEDRTTYRIRHFSQAIGIGVDEADERYVNVTGDTMSGTLTVKSKDTNYANIRQQNKNGEDVAIFKTATDSKAQLELQSGASFSLWSPSHGRTYISVTDAKELELNYLREPASGKHAATMDYVDKQDGKQVSKTGDKMTGDLETTGHVWIRPKDKGANGANNMLVVNQQDATGGSIARFQQNTIDKVKIEYDGTTSFEGNRVTNVGTPTKDADAATKKYVDTASSSTMPIGMIIFWGGTANKIPTGWVECRGQNADASVKAATGMDKIPDLRDYMPAGYGGSFGATLGTYMSSKLKSHSHTFQVREPGNTTGDPREAGDSSSSRYRYWRGNSAGNGADGTTGTHETYHEGGNISAPPVYLGVYIMKIS